MSPTPGDVHVNQNLTNVSIAHFQSAENFVANRAGHIIPVKKQTDLIPRFAKGEMFRDAEALRAPGAESHGVGYELDSALTYYAKVRGWHHDITGQVRANSDDWINQDRTATRLVTNKGLLRSDRMFVANLMTNTTAAWDIKMAGVATGSYSADTNVVHFNDHASSNANPIYEVRRVITRAQLANGGFRLKHGVMTRPVWDALALHPDFVGLISGGATAAAPSLVQRQLVAQAFELDELLVMEGVHDTAAQGATWSPAWIGGNSLLLYYKPMAPALEEPSAFYGFAWTGMTGMSNVGTRIKKFPMTHLDSERVELDQALDWKMTGADMGVLLYDLLA
jgi:hypothetical protein